jgi:tripartite-type tricarboxylate transporter receptor subunit TctC
MLAMERGEVDGALTSYNTLQVSRADWLRNGKINILVQYGEHSPDLPNVPLAAELAKNDEDRALLSFYVSSEQMGRSFLAPPDLPPERVAVLRTAYDETMQDAELLSDIKKSHVEFSPLSGDKVQRLVAETTKVSPAIVGRIRKILDVAR